MSTELRKWVNVSKLYLRNWYPSVQEQVKIISTRMKVEKKHSRPDSPMPENGNWATDQTAC